MGVVKRSKNNVLKRNQAGPECHFALYMLKNVFVLELRIDNQLTWIWKLLGGSDRMLKTSVSQCETQQLFSRL